MEQNKKHIFGILLRQVLWTFLAITAIYLPNQFMRLTESTTFDDSLAASEKTFWDAETYRLIGEIVAELGTVEPEAKETNKALLKIPIQVDA